MLTPLNRTPKNGFKGRFYVMHILSQFSLKGFISSPTSKLGSPGAPETPAGALKRAACCLISAHVLPVPGGGQGFPSSVQQIHSDIRRAPAMCEPATGCQGRSNGNAAENKHAGVLCGVLARGGATERENTAETGSVWGA